VGRPTVVSPKDVTASTIPSSRRVAVVVRPLTLLPKRAKWVVLCCLFSSFVLGSHPAVRVEPTRP